MNGRLAIAVSKERSLGHSGGGYRSGAEDRR